MNLCVAKVYFYVLFVIVNIPKPNKLNNFMIYIYVYVTLQE